MNIEEYINAVEQLAAAGERQRFVILEQNRRPLMPVGLDVPHRQRSLVPAVHDVTAVWGPIQAMHIGTLDDSAAAAAGPHTISPA